jgi:hypothetical protein
MYLHETCRISGMKIDYLEDKTDELVTDSKNKNVSNLYTFMNKFRKVYKAGVNKVENENDNPSRDAHSILNN